MSSNLDRYKADLKRLVSESNRLLLMMYKTYGEKELLERLGKISKEAVTQFKETTENLPSFFEGYQSWYSEALSLIKVLLPDRLSDFIRCYEKPKNRKTLNIENYTIEDFLQGLSSANLVSGEVVVSPAAAIPKFELQSNIVKSIERVFESSLFDIKQILQADLFDSELEAAHELNHKGFARGAGAIAGVVLEKHLSQVCNSHGIKITKKDPSINDLNQLIKDNKIIETKDWRFIGHLADIRNECDHNKGREPNIEDVEELIFGVAKVAKTVL